MHLERRAWALVTLTWGSSLPPDPAHRHPPSPLPAPLLQALSPSSWVNSQNTNSFTISQNRRQIRETQECFLTHTYTHRLQKPHGRVWPPEQTARTGQAETSSSGSGSWGQGWGALGGRCHSNNSCGQAPAWSLASGPCGPVVGAHTAKSSSEAPHSPAGKGAAGGLAQRGWPQDLGGSRAWGLGDEAGVTLRREARSGSGRVTTPKTAAPAHCILFWECVELPPGTRCQQATQERQESRVEAPRAWGQRGCPAQDVAAQPPGPQWEGSDPGPSAHRLLYLRTSSTLLCNPSTPRPVCSSRLSPGDPGLLGESGGP